MLHDLFFFSFFLFFFFFFFVNERVYKQIFIPEAAESN